MLSSAVHSKPDEAIAAFRAFCYLKSLSKGTYERYQTLSVVDIDT